MGHQRVRPVKGQIVRLRGPELVRHVVRTPEVYVIPRGDGEVLLGATVEEMGFDPYPTAGAAMDLLRRAWHVVPGIYDLAFEEVSVGFRPATATHLPVIGRLEDGTYVATGHYRHGVMLAASTGEFLADLIVEGKESELIKPFRPGVA
jgi:glycine oxidase